MNYLFRKPKTSFVSISLWVGLSLNASAVPLGETNLSIDNYTLSAVSRVSRFEYDYTYTAQVTNAGTELISDLAATLSSTSAAMTVTEDVLNVGELSGGATETPTDTFTVRHNRQLGAFDTSAFEWDVSFETATAGADFHAPEPIAANLLLSRSVAWTELSDTPVSLTRFSMGPDGGTDIVLLMDASGSVETSLSIASGLASETSATNDQLLRTMFKFIAESGDTFRIVSTKHSNYALDADSTGDNLILRDIRSGALDTSTAGYLTFEVVTSSPLVLQATGRKTLASGAVFGDAFIDDTTWSTKQVAIVNGNLELTTGTGTSMTLYAPPIDLDIPFDFNPDEIARVSNPEVTPIVKADAVSQTPTKVVDKYEAQLAAAGSDAGTTAAAKAMIADIETDLASEGSQMRYPADFYLAFREGLFARTLQSSDSTDGELGQLTVPYVYFTNETDNDGVNHPFMVIASYGLPDSLALLWDVAKPPGDGIGGAYPDQSVTRSFHREAFLTKIPMRDYGEVESLTENDMNADLATDVNVTVFTHHNRASVSATGMAIDGVVIYPTFNNSLHVAQVDAELSAHGMHSGRGLGVHYHADAHSAKGEGLNLYNDADYEGHKHPPVVSIGFDGVAGYGFYQEGDTTSDGVDTPLDGFGGHEHGDYGYHYHSFTQVEVTETGAGPGDPPGGVEYTAHMLPPLGAWKGRINDIPEFWDNRSPNYVGGNSVYLGTE